MSESEFAPWAEHISSHYEQRWAISIFAKLSMRGFVCQNPDAIDGGYRLEFRKGDRFVIVDRWIAFPTQGEQPGLILWNDSDEYDCTFSIRTPLDIITKALAILASDEDE